jgi:phosphatidylglycerol lysyltransferase
MLKSPSQLSQPWSNKTPRIIEGAEAKSFIQNEKWEVLSPFLRQYGREALAYPTLQAGMEYFVDDSGYIAYVTAQHPVFAREPKQITFSDPVCAPQDYPHIIARFLTVHPRAVFACISEKCAEVLRGMSFKVNCIGYEVELPIQTYNTRGNWKELDMIKRSRNEAKREGVTIREEDIETVNREQLDAVSNKWIGTKKVSDREIWLYARRPVFETEPDVRKFVAYDRDGRAVGFAFYDPMYRDGNIFGYAANILRSDEQRFGRLATAIHMEAMEKFKTEGKQTLNLCLAPFVKLNAGKFNDDWGAKKFFELTAKYGNNIYNFNGLAFHKSKYRGDEKSLYFGSRSFWPSNDIYLAFLTADITRSYFDTLGHLLWGMATFWKSRKTNSTKQTL